MGGLGLGGGVGGWVGAGVALKAVPGLGGSGRSATCAEKLWKPPEALTLV